MDGVHYTVSLTYAECLDAFIRLSRVEGIIATLESAHAMASAVRKAFALPRHIAT